MNMMCRVLNEITGSQWTAMIREKAGWKLVNKMQFNFPLCMHAFPSKKKCSETPKTQKFWYAFKLQLSEPFNVIVWYRFHLLHATRIVIINSWYENMQLDTRYRSASHIYISDITSYGTDAQCTRFALVEIWQIFICLIIWISQPHPWTVLHVLLAH